MYLHKEEIKTASIILKIVQSISGNELMAAVFLLLSLSN